MPAVPMVIFGSSNRDKLGEVLTILAGLNVTIKSAGDFGIDVGKIAETGSTFSENARLKAVAIGQTTKSITIADDSGLAVDVLGGEPGIFSARYEADDQKRITKLLGKLNGMPYLQRTAHFTCAICVYDPRTKKKFDVIGKTDGFIVDRPIGQNGFGYDSIFFSPELGKTFGQATLTEKNFVSHRKRALELVRLILIKLFKTKD